MTSLITPTFFFYREKYKKSIMVKSDYTDEFIPLNIDMIEPNVLNTGKVRHDKHRLTVYINGLSQPAPLKSVYDVKLRNIETSKNVKLSTLLKERRQRLNKLSSRKKLKASLKKTKSSPFLSSNKIVDEGGETK